MIQCKKDTSPALPRAVGWAQYNSPYRVRKQPCSRPMLILGGASIRVNQSCQQSVKIGIVVVIIVVVTMVILVMVKVIIVAVITRIVVIIVIVIVILIVVVIILMVILRAGCKETCCCT